MMNGWGGWEQGQCAHSGPNGNHMVMGRNQGSPLNADAALAKPTVRQIVRTCAGRINPVPVALIHGTREMSLTTIFRCELLIDAG